MNVDGGDLVFLMVLAFLLFTKPGRMIFLVALAIGFLVAVSGCQLTPTRPPFVCSDPTDPKLCAVEKRLYTLETEVEEINDREFHRKSCEVAHGSGSMLCR